MKQKVAILGSTGSIGKSLLKLISKDIKNFQIVLLSANKNYRELYKQANKFNVKNIILTEKNNYSKLKMFNKNKSLNIYNNFDCIKNIFKKKIDYTMSSIVGLEGLEPTFDIIKYTKKIAIANKESIICAWSLIKKELKKHNTQFIPVDSEHFSIWYAIKKINPSNISKIYLTASGGPLLDVPKKKFNKLKIDKILRHPNWSMGKKISIDSSTMMNKVFEVIEAKNIFDIDYKKLSILIHPESYIHAIIQFKDGMINLVAHKTTMEIPIYNTLYSTKKNSVYFTKLNLNKLNNLNLKNIDRKKFPIVEIIKEMPNKNTMFETVIVSANDALVNLYLLKKIKYTDIIKNMLKIVNDVDFIKMKKIKPRNISDIIRLNKKVYSKVNSMKL